MTKMRIEPSPDLYGGKARRSALADHLELVALAGGRSRVDQLADYIGDMGWVRRLDEIYVDLSRQVDSSVEEEDLEDLPFDPTLAAESVFEVLRERQRVLQHRYPFEITANSCAIGSQTEAHLPYLALLALTTCHAHGLPVAGDQPWQRFQAFVARCFRDAGFSAIDFAGSRRGLSFDDALLAAAGAVGLSAIPDVGIRSRRANDENVDVIAHLDRRDGRVGQWSFIGQVTCEKSDGWEAKLSEPAEAYWCRMLCTAVQPHVFLAVPHHAEGIHLSKLVQDRGKSLLDRLNFALWAHGIANSESALIDIVLAHGVVAVGES